MVVASLWIGLSMIFCNGKALYTPIATCTLFYICTCFSAKGCFPYSMLASLIIFAKPEWIKLLLPALFEISPSSVDLKPKTTPLSRKDKVRV